MLEEFYLNGAKTYILTRNTSFILSILSEQSYYTEIILLAIAH